MRDFSLLMGTWKFRNRQHKMEGSYTYVPQPWYMAVPCSWQSCSWMFSFPSGNQFGFLPVPPKPQFSGGLDASRLEPPFTYGQCICSCASMDLQFKELLSLPDVPQVDLQTVKLVFASLLRHRFLSHSCQKASPFPGSSECRFLNTSNENL